MEQRQLHLNSQLNTWLQWIDQRQLQDETRNIYVWRLGVAYIRDLRVLPIFHCSFILLWAFNSLRPSDAYIYIYQYTKLSLVQIMACSLFTAKPLFEPMMVYCYFWPQKQISIKYEKKSIFHYSDVKMGAVASQITSLTIVYSTTYSGADYGKHQSSASLAFVRGINRWPENSPHKWPVMRKMFPFDDVIMCTKNSFWNCSFQTSDLFFSASIYVNHIKRTSSTLPGLNIYQLHPCEKVIGIFFRHKFFTIYFLLFVLIFIYNICEVVNIKSTDFCCISIIGYTSVTFWKWLLGQNPMSH